MPAIKNSKNILFPFQNNVFGRYFDICLLSHCPCSFNCERTRKIAENNLKILKKHDKELADFFIKTLRSAVIYTEFDGNVFLLLNYKKDDEIIEYKQKIMVNKESPLNNILTGKNDIQHLPNLMLFD